MYLTIIHIQLCKDPIFMEWIWMKCDTGFSKTSVGVRYWDPPSEHATERFHGLAIANVASALRSQICNGCKIFNI